MPPSHDDGYVSNDDDDASSWENVSDDDDDDPTSSVWSDWKQHLLAVLVAVVATAYSYRQLQQHQPQTPASVYPVPTPPTARHTHLHDYRRLANVSFCGPQAPSSHLLQPMDFHVRRDSYRAVAQHFVADAAEDDYYLHTILLEDGLPDLLEEDREHILREYDCFASATTLGASYVKAYSYYYQTPSLASLYPQRHAATLQAATLSFTGFAAKFVNLSPDPVLLYWDGRSNQQQRLLGEIPPMEALGTATTPGQSFSVTPVHDPSLALERWVVTADDPVLYYDPGNLPKDARLAALYGLQQLHKEFAKHYLIQAQRPWLANFPRPFPVYPLWPAEYLGQRHAVQLPVAVGEASEEVPTQSSPTRTLELKVVSVAPRVLTIDNFLSDDECQALIDLAEASQFTTSSVYSGSLAQHQRDLTTRSSSNAWLDRDGSTDYLYRRAAQVLQLDEALLRRPVDDDDVHAHEHSVAEALQVVRYRPGEEYTAHHDFVHPPMAHRYQPTRFATLLLYLNEPEEGGHTVFPRALNADFHDGLRVVPQRGKAVLFYNVLPDGNVDDWSQHQSEPVVKGVKYLANLWVWEPHIY